MSRIIFYCCGSSWVKEPEVCPKCHKVASTERPADVIEMNKVLKERLEMVV